MYVLLIVNYTKKTNQNAKIIQREITKTFSNSPIEIEIRPCI